MAFFHVISPKPVLKVAYNAHKNSRFSTLNLSAPGRGQACMESLMKVRLYVLNLFGNEMKAASFGRVLSKALEAAALKKLELFQR